MKNPINLFLAILIMLAPATQANGQGWQWGRASTGDGIDSWAAATDTSGNVYCGGIAIGSGAIDFGYSVTLTVPIPAILLQTSSIWVKYSNSGVPLWAGCTSGGDTYLYNIAVDPSGNLIVFGAFSSPTMQIGSYTLTNAYGSTGTLQYYLAKVDPSGTLLWAINDGNTNSMNESILTVNICTNGGVATDAAGDIYITASFSKPTITIGSTTLINTDPSGGTSDVFVAKYSPSGVLLWVRSLGGSKNDYGFGITVASTDNVYVTGAFYSPTIAFGPDTLTDPYFFTVAYIAKFSSSGIPLWGQSAGGMHGAFGIGIAKDNSGNVYMTGGFRDTSISFANTTITRTYPGVPYFAEYSVQFSPSDSVTWSKTIGSGSASVWGYSIAFARCGEVWVSGNYSDDADIDGHTLSIVAGVDPVFIAGYYLAGGVAGYAGIGSGGDDQNGIACDESGNVFICADIYGIETIDIGPDILTNISSEAFYVGKYTTVVVHPDTTFTVNDTTVSCSLTNITLTGLPRYTNYYWDDSTTTSTRIVHGTGTYFVYNINCGDIVVVDTFHVISLPLDTLHHNYDTIVCGANDAYLNVGLTASAGNNYSWFDGVTGATDTIHRAGTYGVTYLAGCNYNIDTFKVTVFSPCNLDVPQPAMANEVEIYPNPATGELNIDMNGAAYYSFAITNSISQVLIRQKLNLTQTKVDVKELPAGLYFIVLKGENGSLVKKFVKQ